MRLWSIHPQYLDSRGLVALWREALLAQKVLTGKTKGYKKHPQLERFRVTPDPIQSISTYLHFVYRESKRRGYVFDVTKIEDSCMTAVVSVTTAQLIYELDHLRKKLKKRDMEQYSHIASVRHAEAHPMFEVVEGEVEEWERIRGSP